MNARVIELRGARIIFKYIFPINRQLVCCMFIHVLLYLDADWNCGLVCKDRPHNTFVLTVSTLAVCIVSFPYLHFQAPLSVIAVCVVAVE